MRHQPETDWKTRIIQYIDGLQYPNHERNFLINLCMGADSARALLNRLLSPPSLGRSLGATFLTRRFVSGRFRDEVAALLETDVAENTAADSIALDDNPDAKPPRILFGFNPELLRPASYTMDGVTYFGLQHPFPSPTATWIYEVAESEGKWVIRVSNDDNLPVFITFQSFDEKDFDSYDDAVDAAENAIRNIQQYGDDNFSPNTASFAEQLS